MREAIRAFGDNLAQLLLEHVALARAEIRLEGERLLGRGVLIGVGLLWACVGYLVLMGALVALLAQAMSVALAATLVGVTNLGAGAAMFRFAIRPVAPESLPFADSTEQIEKDVKQIEHAIVDPVEPR
jgi:uncharacterized membrane protein YqjE